MFNERLKKIKEQRIESEQLLLDSHIEKFINFDVDTRLKENEELASKDLKSHKFRGILSTSAIVGGFVLPTLLGASLIATGGMSAVFMGAVLISGATAVTLPFAYELAASAKFIFKDAKAHNIDLVENELKSLKQNVEDSAINNKTTVTDYFKATKESLKDSFSKLKDDMFNSFKPISNDKAIDRIKHMKNLQQDLINSPKRKI